MSEFDWNRHWAEAGALAATSLQQAAAELVVRWLPAGAERIADVGSGSGVVACLIAEAVAHATIVGVDASSVSVERAALGAERAGVESVRFVTARADSLPFENSELDAVYSDQLLQYTPDAQAVFAELARVLRPGGRAIVIVPNALNVVFTATALVAGDRHGSRRVYTRRGLGRLARRSGLEHLAWDGYAPAYPVQRLGYFYMRSLAPLGTLAERAADRVDARFGRALSRHFGFGLAGIFTRTRSGAGGSTRASAPGPRGD